MSKPTYPEQIAALVAWYMAPVNSKQSITPLMNALGASHVACTEAPQPDPEHEDLVRQTLLQTLHWHLSFDRISDHDTSLSLLSGLRTNDRWKTCLTTAEDAYALAALLVSITDVCVDVNKAFFKTPPWRRQANAFVRSVLGEWIAPAKLSPRVLTLDAVTDALFGTVWTQLVLRNLESTDMQAQAIVRLHQPAFQRGLCPDLPLSRGTEPVALPPLAECTP